MLDLLASHDYRHLKSPHFLRQHGTVLASSHTVSARLTSSTFILVPTYQPLLLLLLLFLILLLLLLLANTERPCPISSLSRSCLAPISSLSRLYLVPNSSLSRLYLVPVSSLSRL